jgi:hypothetical protein
MIKKSPWRLMQWPLFFISLAVIVLLFNDSLDFLPIISDQLGRKIFWDIIIVSTPLIFLLVPGIWRNICPVGLLSLFPDHYGFSMNKTPSHTTQSILFYIGLFILISFIPLRHFIHEGIVEASLLLIVGLAAIISGTIYKGKSGWCIGLCPLLHVEKLYGMKPLTSFNNVLCNPCSLCATTCLDLKKNEGFSNYTNLKIMERVTVGGFPGFIWGWFQVPDYSYPIKWEHLLNAYFWPLSGLIISLMIYELLRKGIKEENYYFIQLLFSFISITSYYWYRLPEALALNVSEGTLLFIVRGLIILFFSWWFFLRPYTKSPWQRLSKS